MDICDEIKEISDKNQLNKSNNTFSSCPMEKGFMAYRSWGNQY